MAKLTFPNTYAGLIQAEAVPQPRHIIIGPGKITVLTETDLPETTNPNDVVLNRYQFFEAARAVGGQPLETACINYIDNMITTGTPQQKNYWKNQLVFRRKDQLINQLRIGVSGTNLQFDNIFLSGSGIEPTLLP